MAEAVKERFRLPTHASTSNARPVNATSQVALDPKAFHQFLPDLHLRFWLQPTEKFFALLRTHGGKLTHHLLARLVFSVLAPANTESQQTRSDPDGDVGAGYHRQRIKDEG